MRFFYASLILLLISQKLFAQNIIQGQISDTSDQAQENINILLYNPGTDILVAFAVSDDKGSFNIGVESISDSLDIVISSIQFRKEYRRIPNKSQDLRFKLVPEIKMLEGVTIKAPPVQQRGDTISYLVSSFAGKEDRSIEDVLRKMPGIEVEAGGRILYQGVPIQKFYIEGLDLMDGRYAVVSKNLPQASVGSVEILENHQPLKILEGRATSYQPSLNIKLRHNVTATGTAEAGTGATPLLWELNLTPMVFSKKLQLLASYQTNNTGNDVSQQLRVLTLDDFLRAKERPVENPDLLNIIKANPPDISQDRYLDNNIHLLSLNLLKRINNDLQLRVNLYYVNDIQNEVSGLKRTLYSPIDTLSYTEDIKNKLYNNFLNTEFTLNRNVRNNYLNNELKIKADWSGLTGEIINNTGNISESLKDPLMAISNDLKSISPLGKLLVEFDSYISYDNNSQSLYVSPGPFINILNDSISYDAAQQQLDLRRFYTDNSASLVLSWKKLSISPRAGISYRSQLLESSILIQDQNDEHKAGSGFINELEGKRTRIYAQSDLEYRISGFTIKAGLPLSWQELNMEDKASKGKQYLRRLFFDPDLSVDYRISGFWRARASWSLNNRIGDIDRVNYGYILRTYRDLSRNEAPLAEISSNSFSLHLSYRNPISSFFNSLTYVYVISHRNQLFSYAVLSDGATVLQAYDFPNNSYSNNIQFTSSKYFSFAKTTLSIRANYSQHKGKTLLDGDLFNSTNRIFSLKPDLNTKLTNWLNVGYELEASYIQTYIENEKKGNISTLKNKLDIFAFPKKNQLISLNTEYYILENANNLFLDFLYRYTINKKHIDLEFRWNNILNAKNYISYQANDFMVWESEYKLRPSQVLISVKFNLR